MSSMSETISKNLKVVVQDDEHRQSEISGRGKYFLDYLIVVIELVKNDGNSLHRDRPLDRQEDK